MQKALTLALFFTFSVSGIAQFAAQKVLIEVGTGVWCPSCPTAVQLIEKMQDDGHEIAVVKYHALQGDPFENEASLERIDYYLINAYPTTVVDGVQLSPWNSYQHLNSLYEDAIAKERDFRINLTGDWISEDSIKLNAFIEKSETAIVEGTKFFVAVTESDILYDWQGLTEVNYAERALIPDKDGYPLNFKDESQINLNFGFKIKDEWKKENLQFVGFIQSNLSKKIEQTTFFSSNQVSVEEYETKKITVSPNPANDFIKIRNYFGVERLSIFNSAGVKVASHRLQKDETILDVSSLSPGVYFIQGKTSASVYRNKILIK